jgi:hypothetical protein
MRLIISARSALHCRQSASVFTVAARAALLCLGVGVAALTGCASSAPGDPGAPVNPRMTADMGYPPPPPLDFAGMNMPDLAGVAPCVTAPQSGCAAGNKCSTYDYMTTTCAPDGQAARGATCTRTPDSCRAGGLCVEEAPGMAGSTGRQRLPTVLRHRCTVRRGQLLPDSARRRAAAVYPGL